jgi:hypothetical protein
VNRNERIESYYQQSAWELAERIVDLEDSLALYKANQKILSDANLRIQNQGLDPERVESALRMYVAELDYDIHKYIESPEDGGPDRYPEEADYFLRCWHTAGEGV